MTLPAAPASASQPPVEQQPAEQQPAEQQPVGLQPVGPQPVEQQPAEQQPAEQQPAEQQPVEQPPERAEAPQRVPLPSPRAARYVQVVVREAPIVAPGGEVVVRARRGTVLELRGASPRGYEVVLHSGQSRLLPQAAARPVLYRPLVVDDPALRQQVRAALVEAQSRAQQEAGRRARGEARAALARLLADRYAFQVAQRYSLTPPVVKALADADGLAEEAAAGP